MLQGDQADQLNKLSQDLGLGSNYSAGKYADAQNPAMFNTNTYKDALLNFLKGQVPVSNSVPVTPPPGAIEINAPGENDPNKASVLPGDDPQITQGPAPSGSSGKNGALDKIIKGIKKW